MKKNQLVFDKMNVKAFAPIIGNLPNILILGTIPGKESLRRNEYYAHPRNIFWRLLYSLFDTRPNTDYISKTYFIKQKQICIWDVCFAGFRISSLDKDIKKEIPNDINQFVKSNPTICIIAFNGKKAEKLYDKYFNRLNHITYLSLLSTSPTNASYTFDEKFKNWKEIILSRTK